MQAIKAYYDSLPEQIVVPKHLVHHRAEIIYILDEDKQQAQIPGATLTDFFGSIPAFPERSDQGLYEKREIL